MVQQAAQTRLLTSLLKSTKDYTTSLQSHLVASHTSISGLQAYASASTPSTAPAILAVADAFKHADDAIARYCAEVEKWRERLKEIKRAEEDVANILRDREILVNRLIKASSKKPDRASIIHPPSPTASVLSVGSTATAQQYRLTAAQQELQACEAHLATKQRELEQIRSIAIRDGLEQRCMALITLGSTLGDKGNEGIRSLQDGFVLASGQDIQIEVKDHLFRDLPPRPSSPTGISDTSLAPSQSASQTAANESRAPVLTSPYRLNLPAPHAIGNDGRGISDEGHNVPTTSRIQEEDENSSDEDRPVQVVENSQTRSSKTNSHIRSSTLPVSLSYSIPDRGHSSDIGTSRGRLRSERRGSIRSVSTSGGEPRKRTGFFGTFASLFRVKKSSSSANGDRGSPQKQSSGAAWQTRTDGHLSRTRRNSTGSTDDDDDDGLRRDGLVAYSNRPSGGVSISKPKAQRRASTNDATRPNMANRLSKPNSTRTSPKKTKNVKTGIATPEASELSRAGTVRSTMSEPPRARRASLPPSAKISSDSPSIGKRSSLQAGKPLHLTASEHDNDWLNHPPPLLSSNKPSSIPSSSSRHGRNASASSNARPNGPSLMMLVEDVSVARQRNETLSAKLRSNDPQLILPSEYVKTVGSGVSVPSFALNPPTPGEEKGEPSLLRSSTTSKRPTRNLSDVDIDAGIVKHTPPPRSASPLRSALRRSISPVPPVPPVPSTPVAPIIPAALKAPSPVQLSVGSANSSLPPLPALQPPSSTTPINHAATPRQSSSMESIDDDNASAYETGQEDLSDDEGDLPDLPTPTIEKQEPIHNGIAVQPQHSSSSSSNSTATIEASVSANPPVRRKSVRLDVPPSASSFMTEFPPPRPSNQNQSHPPDPPPKPSAPAQSRPTSTWQSRIADTTTVPDVWANSSDEDDDYLKARHLLERATRKEKSARAEMETASKPAGKKRAAR